MVNSVKELDPVVVFEEAYASTTFGRACNGGARLINAVAQTVLGSETRWRVESEFVAGAAWAGTVVLGSFLLNLALSALAGQPRYVKVGALTALLAGLLLVRPKFTNGTRSVVELRSAIAAALLISVIGVAQLVLLTRLVLNGEATEGEKVVGAGLWKATTVGYAAVLAIQGAVEMKADKGPLRNKATEAFYRTTLKNDLASVPEEGKQKVLDDYQTVVADGMQRFARTLIGQLIKHRGVLTRENTPQFLHPKICELTLLQLEYLEVEKSATESLNVVEDTRPKDEKVLQLWQKARNMAGDLEFATRDPKIEWDRVVKLADTV